MAKKKTGAKVAKPKRRKPRGEGSLFQRKDGYWVFQVRHAGNTLTEFLGTKDEQVAIKEAKSAKRKLLGELSHSVSLPGASRGVLVSQVVNDYLDYADANLKSSDIIRMVLERHIINGSLANRKAASITTADLRHYVDRRFDDGAKPASIKNELSYLRGAFNHGRKQTPPTINVVPYFPIPKVNNARTGFLELEHYEALLNELPDSLKLAFVIAYHVGDRKGELLAIDVEQVQLDEGFIVLDPDDTKNNTGRNLPIYGDMGKWLRWQLEKRAQLQPVHTKLFFWHERDVVFGHGGNRVETGAPIKNFRASWNAAVTRMVEASGEKQYTGLLFHDLRRSAVRNMIQKAKIPEAQAMKISGHKTHSMLSRYNIVARQDVAEAGKQLGKWMDSQRGTKS